jgi:hypothetical protein
VGTPSSYASDARRQAAHILSQPPFTTKPSHIPDPLAGVLHAVGRVVDDVLGKPLGWLGRHFFSAAHDVFGHFTSLVLIALAVVIGVLLGVLLIRRRTRIGPRNAAIKGDLPMGEDVGMLEAAADAAEAKGDLDEAVRLRFRAGLARLEAAGVIASRLVTTTDQVRETVHSQTFDALAGRHEAIAYAGQTALPTDASTAREGWPRVIEEVDPAGKAHTP